MTSDDVIISIRELDEISTYVSSGLVEKGDTP